ncbi:MAG: 8-oxo-dGTP pyrophosphatase MutT (NUDIX family) [Candidatus Azotimanducaceae bacterium]|jgi:8-oxo-dGTP pyrophosphatase MutT (NUDIX family)
MICFDTIEGRFNFRSVAVIVHNDHMLIHRNVIDDFWALPGGRVGFFENSEETIQREILEELGYKSKVERHIWHVENFFEYGSKKFHEIANYFLVSLLPDHPMNSELDFEGIETKVNLIFRWVLLNNLKSYNLKPAFLIGKLNDLPSSTKMVKINELHA